MILSLALAVISAAVLAFEVLLVRLFAIVQWHHFSFMAISLALLGFGVSGSLLALCHDWAKARFTALFAAGAIGFAVLAPAGFLIAQSLPFNALAVVWDPSQLLYLPAITLLLTLPFFCGATCIGVAFICHGEKIGRIYACNLMGSALGALGIVIALFSLSPPEALRLVSVLGFLAAGVILLKKGPARRRATSIASLALAALVWAGLPDAWFALRISEFKGLPSALRAAGAVVVAERSGPLGLLTVVDSPEVPFRYLPGLSLRSPALPPPQLGVFIDGGAMTAITRFKGQRAALTHLDFTTDAAAYHLLREPSVLILNAGGGQGILQAIYHGAKHIDAVEADPNMLRLLATDLAEPAGQILSRPEVQAHLAEARGFVTASRDHWDLLQIPLLDGGAGAPGLQGLNEGYLYTIEAFEQYYQHLRPGGWVSITSWLMLPPRLALRHFATALAALRRMGLEAPEDHLVLLRGLTTTTLLVKKGAVSGTDIRRVKAFAEARAFDLSYFPGITAKDVNRFNVQEDPFLFRGAMALAGPGRASFIAGYKFDIAPASDDRPYVFNFMKWGALPELLALRKTASVGLLGLGSLFLAAALLQAAVLSAILTVVPLWLGGRRLARWRLAWPVASYFLAIGFAFLFIEIAFIQKFILFLSHPLYSVAVVLAAFLFFAGIGSALASRFAEALAMGRSRLGAIELSIAGILAISLTYLFALPPIFAKLFHLSDPARILVSLALIAPLAFFMGMPFPLGLSRVRSNAPALVPWAWGVNGCASVLSVLLATLLAMELGFSAVILTAAVLYAGAAITFHRTLANAKG